MGKKYTKRSEDYSKWYNETINRANLAENSGVRGCMVIKPYGFAIWEKIQNQLDVMFKETGHQNAYFPLFVPKSLFEAEEKNAEGFAKECAVVTHHRLMTDPNNSNKLIVDPNAKLEEELIVRPTSEAIIWNTYKGWIQSYRDLPILINQWANVVRWEMRTRLFLRTAEFLWQEGHTAHSTSEEAKLETIKMNDIYAKFAEDYMAMPVIKGFKTASERFAGAEETYCIEAMMQDGKALQAGTSHFLGQNFAKAFDVKFTDKDGNQDYVWATSWGVSTRLMGALIMTHSDDEGLVLPPALAPIQVVAIPICNSKEDLIEISKKIKELEQKLKLKGISFKFDDDMNHRPGWKFAEYEAKGIPIRLAIGMRDLKNESIEVARRDEKTKEIVEFKNVDLYIENLLDNIQKNLYLKAKKYRESKTQYVDSYDEFKKKIDKEGGFLLAHWDGSKETEQKIKDETKATIRCIPLNRAEEPGYCMVTGAKSLGRVVFSKSY
ncbi:MAG: proline--tRNA ligase [Crocinitomicaceae bacterium]|nr:proline--tRNA ligase [Crocinitomicaceae bacterium]|tara:strand:- start:52130 stop:53608 length:1479 start_codon:yes stop_codon:yes gene_type:complete